MTMFSNRPYLLRALLEWINDNRCTPYIVVAADVPGVEVPRDYVKDGKIVLNVSSVAVRGFSIDRHRVSFDGRFAGKSFHVTAPTGAIVAIYAKETGQGMFFDVEATEPPPSPPPREGGNASHLRLVK
jgi:stringent starvation protein B